MNIGCVTYFKQPVAKALTFSVSRVLGCRPTAVNAIRFLALFRAFWIDSLRSV